MKLKTLVLSGLLVASPFCGAAFAQGTGFYVSASYDITSFSVDTLEVTAAAGAVQQIDKTSVGWHGVVGYALDANWAIEAGYVDGGNPVIRGTTTNGTFSARPAITVWTGGFAWTSAINDNWSFKIRAGFHRWSEEWTNKGGIGTIADNDGYDIYYGAHIQYNFNAKFGISLGIDRYSASQRLSTYSGGATLKF